MAKYEYWLTSEGLLKLEAWARNGLTDEQIAGNAGIAVSTLYEWKRHTWNGFGGLKKGKRGSGYSSRERSPEASPGIFVYGKKD